MSVINFPGHEPDQDQLYVRAFRDLEPHIHDCVTMSEIAVQLMGNSECNDGKLAFAVLHLNEMLRDLEKHYRAAWAAAEADPRQEQPGDQRAAHTGSLGRG